MTVAGVGYCRICTHYGELDRHAQCEYCHAQAQANRRWSAINLFGFLFAAAVLGLLAIGAGW